MVALNLQLALCALLSLTSAGVIVFPSDSVDPRHAASYDVQVGKRQRGRGQTTTSSTTYLGRTNPTPKSSSSTSSSTTTSSSSTSKSSPTTTSTSTSSKPSSTTTTLLTTSSTTRSTTTTTSSSGSSTTSAGPIVTDTAYIDTVIRHHNVHRSNHSASAVSWSSSLADTARQIAQSCYYAHNTTANGGGYGQNIAAGYIGTQIGAPITLGFYNNEVNSYTYYGSEPDMNNFGSYGHFTQIVWKATTSVGCYTMDCSAKGLQNVPAGVAPYFTVCNYGPPGNYVGEFNANVGRPLGAATVYTNYGCPSNTNCA